MTKYPAERRRFIRMEIPAEVQYIFATDNRVYLSSTKNISPEGIRFTSETNPPKGTQVKIELRITHSTNPIHLTGKVIWCQRLSLEDGAPYDLGVEFTTVEEDNKNTFLKFLCDTIYDQIKKIGRAS